MRKSVSPAVKSKSKSLSRVASGGLVDFLKEKYPKKVPIAAMTAVTKLYGRNKALNKDDRIVRRLAGNSSDIPTTALSDLLTSQEQHEKGKPLSDEAVRRVYQNFANQEGKLTFEYIMKMGESSGVTIPAKMAKRIVKKYGKKDYLTSDDCLKINRRHQSKSQSPNRR